jgi:integrase
MTSDLTKPPSGELESLQARAVYYGKSTIADRTKKAYETEYKYFRVWAESQALPAMPPDVGTVAMYLAALADGNVEVTWNEFRTGRPKTHKIQRKYAGIQRAYIGIVNQVRAAGHEWPHAIPAITKVMHGIRYRKGDKKKQVAPLEIADLRACLGKMRERRIDDLGVVRDRAILSLGFFSAMRRSELVALTVEDLDFGKDGLTVTIRKSKTDQFAEGQQIGIHPQKDPAICPIALLRRYLDMSGIKSGPLFRRIDYRSDCYGDKPLTPGVIAHIVKAVCEAAGLDPERFSGHSLRAGFITTAAARGVPLDRIMRQSRHKDQRVLQTYIRPATLFRQNPTEGLGDEEPKK